jgi:hypothetical protein
MHKKFIKLKLVNIINDGLVSTVERGEGRFIPSLILDTTPYPEIDDLLRVHLHCPPGDAESVWAEMPFSGSNIALNLKFIRPLECEFAISFIPEKHALLIDAILHAQSLYFLSGKASDRLSTTMENPKILVEVPRSEFTTRWEQRLPKIYAKRFRADGLSRPEARRAAVEMIESMREMWKMRRPSH